MSQEPGALSRRDVMRLGALAGAGLLLGGCDIGGGSSGGGNKGSNEGKITALFMQQAGYSEDDIRSMTADFQKANPRSRSRPSSLRTKRRKIRLVLAARP